MRIGIDFDNTIIDCEDAFQHRPPTENHARKRAPPSSAANRACQVITALFSLFGSVFALRRSHCCEFRAFASMMHTVMQAIVKYEIKEYSMPVRLLYTFFRFTYGRPREFGTLFA